MPSKDYPGTIETWTTAAGMVTHRLTIMHKRKRHSWTLRNVDRAEVEEYARDRKADLVERSAREDRGLPGHVTVGELARRFEADKVALLAPGSRKSYGSTLRYLSRFMDTRRIPTYVHEVEETHVADFLSWLPAQAPKGRRMGAHTLARHRRVLHRMFGYAVRLRILDRNPVTLIEAPKADAREYVILSDAELGRLLDAAPSPMLRFYLLLLAESGLRSVSEALRLTWRDMDLTRGTIRVRAFDATGRPKSGKGRSVPMTRTLLAAAREHAATYRLADYGRGRVEWVFHHVEHGRHGAKPGDPISRKTGYRSQVAKAARAAELPEGWRVHDLRHRRVTTWLREGRPLVLVQRAMGHSTPMVTSGYLHLVDDDLRALVDDAPAREAVAS